MYRLIRSRAYFPGIASKCNEFVVGCFRCKAADWTKGDRAPPTRLDIPCGPWSEVVIDTLELGGDNSGRYHCVLVCVDVFTKWVEVCPLPRHDASVASAFASMCLRWGAPEDVRLDNGTEFSNAIVESLFCLLGVRVLTGAVRHPQSQGAVERVHRTLLGLIRKVLDSSSNWREDLDILLHYYRNRPHSTTRISPMEAMVGWTPRQLVVEAQKHPCSLSAWVDELSDSVARVHDLVEDALSQRDFIDSQNDCCLYSAGQSVLLRRPDRHKKSLTPYDSGWFVEEVISPSAVVISNAVRGGQKTVNVDVLKPDPAVGGFRAERLTDSAINEAGAQSGASIDVTLEMPDFLDDGESGYNLRNRDSLRVPSRYS